MNNNSKPEDPLDEVRGGSELVNYCRFVLMTELPKHQKKDDEQKLIVFRIVKMSNSILPEDKVISFAPENDGLKVSYEGKPEEILTGEQQCANAIKEYLFLEQIKGEFKTGDMLKAYKKIGFGESNIKRALKLLVENKFLEKIKQGIYKITGNIPIEKQEQT